MREILFRGKCSATDKWIDGYYVRLNGEVHCIYTGYAEKDLESYYPDFYKVHPETVGQYTGMTDKNGTRIFEGDIVHVIVTDAFGYEDDFNMEVDDMTKYDLLMILDTANEVEVIGCVYEDSVNDC